MAPTSPKSAARRRLRVAPRLVFGALLTIASAVSIAELGRDDRRSGVLLLGLCAIGASATFLALSRTRRREMPRARGGDAGAASTAEPSIAASSVTARSTAAASRAAALTAPAAPLATPAEGDMIGPYQLLALLSEDEAGCLWAARHSGSTLERIVTIKTSLERGQLSPSSRHAFIGEARIAALLRHPNVCSAYETGNHQGVLYQVGEWCDGASLAELLARLPRRRMETAVAVLVVAKVSAGVHAAHELEDEDGQRMGVLHGALSADDVRISSKGQVKVSGFGLQARERLGQAGARSKRPGPWSPEQRAGAGFDHRADIFALGRLLYEATLGVEPGSSSDESSTFTPPRMLDPTYPLELETIVLRATAQSPGDRYGSAEELGIALRTWLARSAGVVTEQAIAELMARAAGPLIADKSRCLQEALLRWPRHRATELSALAESAQSADGGTTRPTLPAAPRARKATSTR